MTTAKTAACALLVASCLWSAGPLSAHESTGTPAARALFDKAEDAAKAGKPEDAIALFRKATTADPDFVDAHQRLIEVTQRLDLQANTTDGAARLRKAYEQSALSNPKRAVYPFALGVLTTDLDAADALFKKALALDPAFARAQVQLAKNADTRADWAAQREYLKAAVASSPNEPRYLMSYALAMKRSDGARFRELAQQVIEKFPGTPSAAQALANLASESTNPERRGYLDRLRAEYPVQKFGSAASAMNDLYAELPPADALVLAREMVTALPALKFWVPRVTSLDALVKAQSLVAAGKFGEASDVLAHASPPTGDHGVTWTLVKAEAAAGAGHADQAYASLVDSTAAVPNSRIDAALAKYGASLKKSGKDVDADIWRARDAKATVAPLFELPSPREGAKPVRLADYRGRVVLLAFWYPT